MSAERRRPGRHAKPTRRARTARDDHHPARDDHHPARGGHHPARGEQHRARGEQHPAADGATARGPGDRAAIAVAGTAAALVAVSVVVVVGTSKHPDPAAAKAAAARSAAAKGARPRDRDATTLAVTASPAATAPGDPDEDRGAIAYYQEKDPRDDVVKHVDEVRWSGRYLRVYTDLKESDTHSRVALELCRWTSEYLTDQRGDHDPVVFVHAKKNDNGNVVLVNKLSAKDSCKSVETL